MTSSKARGVRFPTLKRRGGQAWINDDRPASWSVALVLETEIHTASAVHRLLILEAGPQSGYKPGDVVRWAEDADEPGWDDGYGCMRRLA